MLKIRHLEKRFDEKVLFRDLCLTVDGPAVLWAVPRSKRSPSACCPST